MKPGILLFSLFSFLSVGFAQEPGSPQSWDMHVELQIVTMPEEAALSLVPELRDPKTVEAANARLQKMIAGKQATLIGWPILRTQSGQKAVVQMTNEIRYATEYTPPTIPSESFDANGRKKISDADPILLAAIPAQFDTRNTGVTLEIEATVLEEGKFIEASVVPQHVRLKGFNKIALDNPGKGVQVVVEQPEFEVTQTTTSLRLKNGERVILGVHKTSAVPDQIEIHILKVEVTKQG